MKSRKGYSEVTAKFYQNTRCHIAEDCNFHSDHSENLKSDKTLFFSDGMMLLCQWVKGDCSQSHTTT
jgi:hypothetical protein